MRTLIFSANVGGYDLPFLDPGVLYVEVRPEEGEHPRMAAKRVKMLRLLPPGAGDWDYAVWVDANMELRSDAFPAQAIEETGDHALGVFAHPRRDDVEDEAYASHIEAAEKYQGLPLYEQVRCYRRLGLPYPSGLYAGGVVVWNMRHEQTQALASAWLAECEEWSYQDQLSLPFVLWRMGLQPAVFSIPLLESSTYVGNRWVGIRPHLSRR